jgi:hypothetical protein
MELSAAVREALETLSHAEDTPKVLVEVLRSRAHGKHCLVINEMRIGGIKMCGIGNVVHEFRVSISDLANALVKETWELR